MKYKGHSRRIYREESESGPYKYEFYLEIDGEEVMTATELEKRGRRGPEDGGDGWYVQLSLYSEAYIDGLENND